MNQTEQRIAHLEEEVRALNARLERQNIVVKVLQIMQSAKNLLKAMNEALAVIGNYTGVSRVKIFEKSADGNSISNIVEWCNEGIASNMEMLQNLPIDTVPWFDIPDEKERFYLSDDQTLAPKIAEVMALHQIKSILVFPMISDGFNCGFADFNDCIVSRVWDENDVELLKHISQILCATKRRFKAEEELSDERDRLRAIGDNFPGGSLFRIELYPETKYLHYTYLSETWPEVTGLDIQQSLADPVYSFNNILPEDRKILMKRVFDFNNTQNYNTEVRMNHTPSGELRWLQISAHIYHASEKHIIYDGFILDITARKHAEQELLKERNRLQSIGDNFPDGSLFRFEINTQTGGMRFVYLSGTWEKVTGISIKESLADSSKVFALILPEHMPKFMEEIEKSVVALRHYFIEIQFYKGSEVRWLLLSSHPKKNAEDIVVYDGFILDITARKEAEIALIHAKEKAEESDKLKSAFLANMSHEILTPLNGIIGFLDFITSDELEPLQKQEYVNIINSSAAQLTHLINDIIDVSKIQSKQMDILPVPVDVNQLMKETHIFFKKYLHINKKENIMLKLDKSGSINNCTTIVDPTRLRQVLNILISNAVKFTDKGYIRFGYRQPAPDMLEFVVEDTGIGMKPFHIEIIFEAFRQIESDSTRYYGGTGLGLNIAKSLVHMMGGDIWVESTEGAGSAFYFTIRDGIPEDR